MGILNYLPFLRSASLPVEVSQKVEPTVAPRAAVQSSGGGQVINVRDSGDLERALRDGVESASGAVVTTETAMRVAAVFGCVRIISGAVANMPLQLKRRVDDRTRENASDHPLWAILQRKPNRWMTPSGFRRMLQAHVLLRGNAYCRIVRSGSRILQLIPLHPDRVEPKQQADFSVQYEYTRKDGRKVIIRQDDMFHLIGLTLDGISGVSVIKYAKESIGLSIQTERHGATMFKNGTHLGSVLRHPDTIGQEGKDFLEASLEAYRGADNAHKNLILEEGMEYQSLGMTAEDAQFIESRKFSRLDIAMFFGVPPHMLGDTEKQTSFGSGVEQQGLGFVAYTLEDWLTGWEQTCDRDCLAETEPDLYHRFNRAALVRGDIKSRFGAYAVGRQWGWLSANDVRAAEDQNPIEGGDTYFEPLNMAPTDSDREDGNEPP